MTLRLQHSALAVTLAVTLLLIVMPVYQGRETRREAGTGPARITSTSGSLIAVNGAARTLLMLAVPVVLTIIPVVSRKTTTLSASALLLFALVTGASLGLWYIPSALILFAASVISTPSA